MNSATTERYQQFIAKYGYTHEGDVSPLLALSFAFLSALPFREGAELDDDTLAEAQCFIAYAMSTTGGGFNPAAIAEAKTLTKKGIGKSEILKEWKVNELLIGNDPISLLRSMVIPYGLLNKYLCTGKAGVFVI